MYYTIESGEGVICEKLFEYVELFWLFVFGTSSFFCVNQSVLFLV